jgi:hypothetical protein
MLIVYNSFSNPNRFTITDPARFRIGDLVEIQMTVVAVPVKGGRFKMITQLRTLAQLDCHFSHVKSLIFIMTDHLTSKQPRIAPDLSFNYLQSKLGSKEGLGMRVVTRMVMCTLQDAKCSICQLMTSTKIQATTSLHICHNLIFQNHFEHNEEPTQTDSGDQLAQFSCIQC